MGLATVPVQRSPTIFQWLLTRRMGRCDGEVRLFQNDHEVASEQCLAQTDVYNDEQQSPIEDAKKRVG